MKAAQKALNCGPKLAKYAVKAKHAAAKFLAKTMVRKVGEAGLKKTGATASAGIMRAGRAELIDTAVNKALGLIKKEGLGPAARRGGFSHNKAKNICKVYVEKFHMRLKAGGTPEPKKMGIPYLGPAMTNCKDNSKGLECAKAVLEIANLVDPTGLSGVAAAFMHRTCTHKKVETTSY